MDGAEQRAMAAAERLADLCDEVLGDGLRSVVLHGSLATGGFRPGRSDLDLLVLVDDRLTDEQADALVVAIGRADAGSAAAIDLHVVTAEVARVPSPDPELELELHVSRIPEEVETTRRTRDGDLLTELSIARATGRALRGTAPAEVIAPVPTEWVVGRNRVWLDRWRSLADDEQNAAFMVLTACRMWRFAIEHVHSGKGRAGAWALDRDPSLRVVRQALRQYGDDPGVRVDPDGIAALLERVLAETGVTHDPAVPSRVDRTRPTERTPHEQP